MHPLSVTLFGRLRIQQGARLVIDLTAKAQELLCYLLLHRSRAHTREALSELLWPQASSAQAKKYLRQTLWQLQAALDACDESDGSESRASSEPPESQTLLMPDAGWLRLNSAAMGPLDVDVFEDAFQACHQVRGHDLSDHAAQTLAHAAALYQGDLLETWYQDWCVYERERLQLTYLAMLEKLMEHCEARGKFAQGLIHGQNVLRFDPAREYTHRQIMRLYHKAGDRTGALRQFERCAAALAREFNLPPMPETLALREHICARHLADDTTYAPVRGQTQAVALNQSEKGSDGHLQRRLDQIQMRLSAVHDELQQELAAIRGAMRMSS